MQDIQSSIDKLNIASSDKEKLRQEIDQLNRDQVDLNAKISDIEEELEAENSKKKLLEREINELGLQINSQKAAGNGKEESQRVGWLREELAKKQIEISSAQRQYKELLEQKFEGQISPSKMAARGPSADLNV